MPAEPFGPVDLLINNLSVLVKDGAFDSDRGLWAVHLAVNRRAPLVLTEQFGRRLPPERLGNVANILDPCNWSRGQHFMSNTVNRMGPWTLTKTLAAALAPRIRGNAPGPEPTLQRVRQKD